MQSVNYYLPNSIDLCGVERKIRTDFRPALDICVAMQDENLKDYDKMAIVLNILYIEMPEPELYTKALLKALNFLSCGGNDDQHLQNSQKKTADLIFWAYDFDVFVPALNRVAGCDVRGLEYLHWWTFVSMFQEIGECFFGKIISIREAKATGRKLSDEEKKFFKKHKDTIFPKLRQSRENDFELMRKIGIMQ